MIDEQKTTSGNIFQINQQLASFFDATIAAGASDLLLSVGVPPVVRVDGKIMALPKIAVLSEDQLLEAIKSSMLPNILERFINRKEVDYSIAYKDTRFRVNAYHQQHHPAAAFRLIPKIIPSLSELGAPPILERFGQISQGLVIITGPTGHGKSTTLAAIVEYINQTRSGHIITIEDPIEYTFKHNKSLISQREVGTDTDSFAQALKSSLREDPNVVLVGEMRDLETIDAALTLAETGHLVLTTLHTNSAAQTPDRIIDVFPPHQQSQVRQLLASVLVGVVSQRLVPKPAKGRILASEIMIATGSVKSLIREGKTHQLTNVIATSAADGMIPLDKVLAEMVSKGEINMDEALTWANDPLNLKQLIY